MSDDKQWTETRLRLPDRGQAVEWISPGGFQERGKFAGGLVWFPDGSDMYVYYTPLWWLPVQEGQR